MKYWNKQHRLRKHWYKVTLKRDDHVPNFFPYYDGWTNYSEFDSTKHELQMHRSDGKFYMKISHKDIYFEKERDAVYFSLKYL